MPEPAAIRAEARRLVAGAEAAIEASRSRIDDLNVYPVPDGDTGTNLTLTVRAVREALEANGSDERPTIAKEIARAALLGARGNSGVILSQIVRGATEAFERSDDFARIFGGASEAAYRAVKKPVEGTMLTAIAAMAAAAEAGGDLDAVVVAGEQAVVRTQSQLPVLTEAGVVDAGAAGLVEIVRGIRAVLAGEALPEAPAYESEVGHAAIHQDESRYRYCTVFFVEGDEMDADALEAELEQLGDSLLVVGDPNALKVHVHTDDPGRALSLGVARGTIGGVEVANMHEQAREREARLAVVERSLCGVVAVAAGYGNRQLLESLGASVVDGTTNPSTAELIVAVQSLSSDEAVIVPNDGNVLLAAEQAMEHAGKPVRVVPTRSLQAGFAALVVFDSAVDAEANERAMREAAGAIVSGAVTVASRDVTLDGIEIHKGEWLGLVDETAVAAGKSFEDVAHRVVGELLEEPRSLLTLLTGAEKPPLNGLLDQIGREHTTLEIEVHDGGQPHFPLLLSAE